MPAPLLFSPQAPNTIANRIPAMLTAEQRNSPPPLPPPAYIPPSADTSNSTTPNPLAPAHIPTRKAFLAVETFARHMTNEGHQLQQGLASAGYELFGKHFPQPADISPDDSASVPAIVKHLKTTTPASKPIVCIMQDKREWDDVAGCSFDKSVVYRDSQILADHPEIFKLTVCKDAHQRPPYHRRAAEEIGCHAWITYYHPAVVCALAPYIRPQHLIRTYHGIDSQAIPPFEADNRSGCLLSGAASRRHYPLRTRLHQRYHQLPTFFPDTKMLKHPGYGADGTKTTQYLQVLSCFKVAICTSSRYAFALRKLIEATACGCIAITDLPTDEVLPYIDGNLVRVSPDANDFEMARVIQRCLDEYDVARQEHFATMACRHYDFRVLTAKLADDIEAMRRSYNGGS